MKKLIHRLLIFLAIGGMPYSFASEKKSKAENTKKVAKKYAAYSFTDAEKAELELRACAYYNSLDRLNSLRNTPSSEFLYHIVNTIVESSFKHFLDFLKNHKKTPIDFLEKAPLFNFLCANVKEVSLALLGHMKNANSTIRNSYRDLMSKLPPDEVDMLCFNQLRAHLNAKGNEPATEVETALTQKLLCNDHLLLERCDAELGFSLLHYAVFNQNVGCAQLLFANTTDAKKIVNLKDKAGNSPLKIAIALHDHKMVQLLLYQGAHVSPDDLKFAQECNVCIDVKDSVRRQKNAHIRASLQQNLEVRRAEIKAELEAGKKAKQDATAQTQTDVKTGYESKQDIEAESLESFHLNPEEFAELKLRFEEYHSAALKLQILINKFTPIDELNNARQTEKLCLENILNFFLDIKKISAHDFWKNKKIFNAIAHEFQTQYPTFFQKYGDSIDSFKKNCFELMNSLERQRQNVNATAAAVTNIHAHATLADLHSPLGMSVSNDSMQADVKSGYEGRSEAIQSSMQSVLSDITIVGARRVVSALAAAVVNKAYLDQFVLSKSEYDELEMISQAYLNAQKIYSLLSARKQMEAHKNAQLRCIHDACQAILGNIAVTFSHFLKRKNIFHEMLKDDQVKDQLKNKVGSKTALILDIVSEKDKGFSQFINFIPNYSPLIVAALAQDIEKINEMMSAGQDVAQVDASSYSVLHYAVLGAYVNAQKADEIIKLLVNTFKADVSKPSYDGLPAFLMVENHIPLKTADLLKTDINNFIVEAAIRASAKIGTFVVEAIIEYGIELKDRNFKLIETLIGNCKSSNEKRNLEQVKNLFAEENRNQKRAENKRNQAVQKKKEKEDELKRKKEIKRKKEEAKERARQAEQAAQAAMAAKNISVPVKEVAITTTKEAAKGKEDAEVAIAKPQTGSQKLEFTLSADELKAKEERRIAALRDHDIKKRDEALLSIPDLLKHVVAMPTPKRKIESMLAKPTEDEPSADVKKSTERVELSVPDRLTYAQESAQSQKQNERFTLALEEKRQKAEAQRIAEKQKKIEELVNSLVEDSINTALKEVRGEELAKHQKKLEEKINADAAKREKNKVLAQAASLNMKFKQHWPTYPNPRDPSTYFALTAENSDRTAHDRAQAMLEWDNLHKQFAQLGGCPVCIENGYVRLPRKMETVADRDFKAFELSERQRTRAQSTASLLA